jgi:predicted acetyltransferase
MSLQLSWVGEEGIDRVARTRFRCYAPANSTVEKFDHATRHDGRQRAGDFLLATRDGCDVGTATSLSMHMWIRGARVPTQGVAWVGTVKTERRGGNGDARGVASQVMAETIRIGRERGDVVSALMPFRASFYEHFGYGNAEQRVEWTVPVALLPRGDFDGWRFYESDDDDLILDLREGEAQRGQCDVETTPAAWSNWQREWSNGLGFVCQPTHDGPVEAWARVVEERGPHTATAVVDDWACATPAAFRQLLHFLASLKDQYTFARITLPGDWPLNRMLRETQIPHRQVDHPVAAARPYTRMQIRVLDHRHLLEAMTLPTSIEGKLNVAIAESEGTTTRLGLELQAGRISVTSAGGTPDIELNDVLWASIVTGDLRAAAARQLGLIPANTGDPALALLDAFAAGPAPFCQEYF